MIPSLGRITNALVHSGLGPSHVCTSRHTVSIKPTELQSDIQAGMDCPNKSNLPKPDHSSLAKPAVDSLDSSYADGNFVNTNSHEETSKHPFSPFYSYPTTRTSFEQQKSESKINITVYQHDLESGSRVTQSVEAPRTTQAQAAWPGKSQNRSLCCQKKSHNPLKRLSKKQKLLVEILIALVVVGAVVGLCIGIAKATGTGVWKNANSESAIGGDPTP